MTRGVQSGRVETRLRVYHEALDEVVAIRLDAPPAGVVVASVAEAEGRDGNRWR